MPMGYHFFLSEIITKVMSRYDAPPTYYAVALMDHCTAEDGSGGKDATALLCRAAHLHRTAVRPHG